MSRSHRHTHPERQEPLESASTLGLANRNANPYDIIIALCTDFAPISTTFKARSYPRRSSHQIVHKASPLWSKQG